MFLNRCRFSNQAINVYPYKRMDDWKKTNETSLPEKKKDVYCHLNMDYFTHADYGNRKGVYKDFEINFFGK